jgi:predicted small metal-binding protein
VAKVIRCPCGHVLRAETDDEVVQRALEHAKEVHNMDLPEERARSMIESD